ncbi:transcriptional regulator [Halovivax asiaticus JCM 14624]|uniref:Transcriptional regulator n=1 Tax=Halovivax asiaticus JCM 14624 TaxID=1227490 RepID=M0BEB2_9EURY|nr:helix-turn-helix domain-containing protein [Halovivax asiaticus]ELZ08633.1 transcriptional regulator [Halovivax asiaticus JCM 14624]
MIEECLVVEFRVTGDGCPLAEASAAVEAPIDAAPPLDRANGTTLLRFSTPDGEVGEVLDADDRIRYLHRTTGEQGTTFRCVSTERCVVHRLIDRGFLVESIRYRDGSERHVGAVVGQTVLQDVLETAGETVGVQLVRLTPLGEDDDSPIVSRWNLTAGQAEALETAHEMGYFEVPRRNDAAAVAAELGVSKSAFLERLRRAEGTLLERAME